MKAIAEISAQSIKPTPRFVVVLDGCPSDRIKQGDDEIWHTLAVLEAGSLKDVENFIACLEKSLKQSGLALRKWGGGAISPKRIVKNKKYRDGFLKALSEALPNSRVALVTVSCQEKTIVASEKNMCAVLGLEYVIVATDTTRMNLSGYIRHQHNGKEMVTLGAFEKISVDGSSEVISCILVTHHADAIIRLWMAYILSTLYKNTEALYQSKPLWSVHFDRLAGDQVNENYPGLRFVNLLLSAATTIDLKATYSETDTSPDLVVDCIAGWINGAISEGSTTEKLGEELGETCKGHLDFQVVIDDLGLAALKFNISPQS